MSVFWLCWEVGWAETQGLSPKGLLRAAGTPQHPFVVARGRPRVSCEGARCVWLIPAERMPSPSNSLPAASPTG